MGNAELTRLREQLRAQRRGLPADAQQDAAEAVCRRVAALGLPRPGSRIAAYLPADGELDTEPLISRALRLGCDVYIPVVVDMHRRRMAFAPLADGATLRRNRWGLWEPEATPVPVTRWLDLVLVPCVGFDATGHRLGMGAGFYDRHFAFLHQRRAWRRPLLLGLAHAFQQLEALPARPWDVPVAGIVTDSAVIAPDARLRRRAQGGSA